MKLSCLHCRQSFDYQNLNLARHSIQCPNSLCGKWSPVDSLIESEYGPELSFRVNAMLSLLSKGPNLGAVIHLNERIERLCRERELEKYPSLRTKVRVIVPQTKIPWYKRERQQTLSKIQGL